jgi:hypothetical protein
MNLSKSTKRLIRLAVSNNPGFRNNIPIEVVPGKSKPVIKGRGYHFRNKSGDLIRHPNAYAKAWGKPIYYPSTLRIEIGEQFLKD